MAGKSCPLNTDSPAPRGPEELSKSDDDLDYKQGLPASPRNALDPVPKTLLQTIYTNLEICQNHRRIQKMLKY